MIPELISKHIELLNGNLFTSVTDKDVFTIIEAFVPDNSWNFIIPKVNIGDFSFLESESIINLYKGKKDFSYYLPESLHEEYKDKLNEMKYSLNFVDTYIGREIIEPFSVELNDKESFEEVTDNIYKSYLEQTQDSFQGWDTEELYVKTFYDLGQRQGKKEFRNFISKNSEDIIAFGSLIFSKELNLAYLHNSGTNEKYRRKGYFSKLKKLMCNYLLDKGITNVYALVEENGGSYHALKKLDFEVQTNYFIYSK